MAGLELDVEKARSQFPGLANNYIFADNAGGSQCTKGVIDAICDYLSNTNVQLGADYSVSVASTKRVDQGPAATADLINAQSPDEIAFGSSSTMLVDNLSRAMDSDFEDGDEIVVTGEHECNVGPWKKLAAKRGLTIKTWHSTPTDPKNPYSVALKLEELAPLLSAKTRIVAFTAASNVLGGVVDVPAVTALVKKMVLQEKGGRKVETIVDCVAYAPHRRIDVQAWDVDYMVFSYYKVYGPHTSALYVRANSLRTSLKPIIHHFLASHVQDKPYKIQPGGPGYELVYATTQVVPYLKSLSPEGTLDDAFARIAAQELRLLQVLLGWLASEEAWARGVRIVGSDKADEWRVPTVSFVVVGERALQSKDIVAVFDKKGTMGIRWGHFYAYTLVESLQPALPDIEDGVVRISLVHYNTVEEVDTLISVLKEALGLA